jgi:hypothetical protein
LHKVDRLTDNDVLHITDVFVPEFLQDIIKEKGHPKYIVTDHWGHMDFGIDIHCVPLFAAQIAEIINTIPDDDYQTQYTFNFLVNKKQVNRFVCLKLIEFFKLQNYNYTHCGFNTEFDLHEIIQELDYLGARAPLKDWDRSFILGPSTIPPKYFLMPGTQQAEEDVRLNIASHADLYLNHVKFVIKNSAISLITESNWGQRGSTFTEKTVYPILGLTMPIWIGGWQQATAWKRMGFDTFDDIINHDYQNYETQIEQFYYAFHDNLELLSNFEKTAKLREQLMPRLKNNQELLLNGQLIRYVKNEIRAWPADLQSIVPDLMQKFPGIKHHFNGSTF